MITARELERLAGLFEGEGSFCVLRRKAEGRDTYYELTAAFVSSDRDVAEWVQQRLGAGAGLVRTEEKRPSKRPRKPMYHVHVWGYRAAGWMMTLYSMLGQRRRAQIQGSLARWYNGGQLRPAVLARIRKQFPVTVPRAD